MELLRVSATWSCWALSDGQSPPRWVHHDSMHGLMVLTLLWLLLQPVKKFVAGTYWRWPACGPIRTAGGGGRLLIPHTRGQHCSLHPHVSGEGFSARRAGLTCTHICIQAVQTLRSAEVVV